MTHYFIPKAVKFASTGVLSRTATSQFYIFYYNAVHRLEIYQSHSLPSTCSTSTSEENEVQTLLKVRGGSEIYFGHFLT